MEDYFIKFEDSSHRGIAAMAIGESELYFSRRRDDLLIGNLSDQQVNTLQQEGATLIPAQQYEPLNYDSLDQIYQPLISHAKNLTHVLSHIHAPQAWHTSKGEDVHIAIIDTGISGTMLEFPAWKRSPHEWSYHSPAWTDLKGHGSMVACIAAATSQTGGRYDGVAPKSKLISCKTSFKDTELFQIYEFLIDLVTTKKVSRLVVNNSYGSYQCKPPNPNPEFINIIKEAVKEGIVVVFAAGNNHVKVCGNDPLACNPGTIWGANSLDQVFSVGTVDENNRMDLPPTSNNGFCHRDSSRGPGQLAENTKKPDCVAPTYGEVMWGSGYQALEWWGTSGAAPQVGGLAALLLSKYPNLKPEQIYDVICNSCTSLPLDPNCCGFGLINCERAMSKVKNLSA